MEITNLQKINLKYRMSLMIRKSELKTVFKNLLDTKMRFFMHEKKVEGLYAVYIIFKHPLT